MAVQPANQKPCWKSLLTSMNFNMDFSKYFRRSFPSLVANNLLSKQVGPSYPMMYTDQAVIFPFSWGRPLWVEIHIRAFGVLVARQIDIHGTAIDCLTESSHTLNLPAVRAVQGHRQLVASEKTVGIPTVHMSLKCTALYPKCTGLVGIPILI